MQTLKHPRGGPREEPRPLSWWWLRRPETWGVALALACGVPAMALLSILGGAVGRAVAGAWRGLFGWGAYPVVVLGLAGAVQLLAGQQAVRWLRVSPRQVLGLELVLLGCLGLAHLPYPTWEGLSLAKAGRGGGVVGWGLVYLLERLGSRLLAGLLLFAAAVGGAALLFDLSWALVRAALGQFVAVVGRQQSAWPRDGQPSPPPAELPVIRQSPAARRAAPPPSPPVAVPRPAPKPAARRWRPPRSASLPPLELLAPAVGAAADDAEARLQRQIIEETLANFGVPAQVVEVRHGPTVTQFGVEPGFIERKAANGMLLRRKVRVGRIAALANDLALALAAPSIRIEAPVPGRPLVGIEVPNRRASLVNLRSVMEADAFRRIQSPLRVALGQDVSGQAVAADLASMPHLLIAGATGSGKSVCINALIACLLMGNTPEGLRLVLVDPKRVELVNFNGIPHLLAPVVVEVDQTVAMLRWLCQEMDRRYKEFAQAGVRHIEGFNVAAGRRRSERMPYLCVFIDELADLMMVAPDEVERSICRLAQMGRATGIHLVIATQRPSVDVVTGLIKANFPARIAFAVSSQVDSRVILDASGAEQLLGRGDMLYMSPEANRLVRLQGCFVSDAELAAIVKHWREAAPADEEEPEQPPPWTSLLEEEPADGDEALLREATEIVVRAQQASTSLLQRRLRVGYGRAARLMEELEARGVVGPDPGGGRPRQVYLAREDADGSEDEEEP